jgi:hypothetical protein
MLYYVYFPDDSVITQFLTLVMEYTALLNVKGKVFPLLVCGAHRVLGG